MIRYRIQERDAGETDWRDCEGQGPLGQRYRTTAQAINSIRVFTGQTSTHEYQLIEEDSRKPVVIVDPRLQVITPPVTTPPDLTKPDADPNPNPTNISRGGPGLYGLGTGSYGLRNARTGAARIDDMVARIKGETWFDETHKRSVITGLTMARNAITGEGAAGTPTDLEIEKLLDGDVKIELQTHRRSGVRRLLVKLPDGRYILATRSSVSVWKGQGRVRRETWTAGNSS